MMNRKRSVANNDIISIERVGILSIGSMWSEMVRGQTENTLRLSLLHSYTDRNNDMKSMHATITWKPKLRFPA